MPILLIVDNIEHNVFSMADNKPKTCPRCNNIFECNADAGRHCQCAQVELTQADREYIALQYDDCLCVDCLKQIRDR
ncbi:MAG: cysteine-rich CWC family protein [Gammaproteobacteria bacterium]|nr:cysteine-rich CWC family protein [Gammaproteobacteria bacterium]